MVKHNALSRGHLEPLECRAMLHGVPQLVSDVSSLPPDEFDFARLGNEVLFPVDDGTGDVELWKSDGTPDGLVDFGDFLQLSANFGRGQSSALDVESAVTSK